MNLLMVIGHIISANMPATIALLIAAYAVATVRNIHRRLR